MRNKKLGVVCASIVGTAIVLRLAWRGVDSRSPDLAEKAPDRWQLNVEESDVIASSANSDASADDKHERLGSSAQEVAIEHPHPLADAQADLEIQVNDSLDGVLYVNAILDRLLEYAALPVSESVDFEYEDDDSVAYRVLGLPDGTVGHFLVGLRPVERNGSEYLQFQLEIQMQASSDSDFYQDSWREGPRVHIALDQDENGEPAVLALLTERKVDLHDSRKRGVDAYQGRFTSGASFRVDINDPLTYWAETFGILNGHYSSSRDFGAVPLLGDLNIDRERVVALSRLFQQHYDNARKREK